MGKKKAGRTKKTKKKPLKKTRTTIQDELMEGDSDLEETNEVEQDDYEFYQTTDRSLEFLTNLTATDSHLENGEFGRKRKRKSINNEEHEKDYEKQPRLSQEKMDDQQVLLLPIKSQKGFIQRLGDKPVPQDENETKDTENKDNTESEVKKDKSTPAAPTLSVVELYARRQQKLNQRKVRIAELSNAIIEKPEENISQLKELCSYCEEQDVDVRITTRKLAMVSLLEVFKDIVPGYTIRLSTEKEKEIKVSKDIRTLREYEEGLVTTYQKYLQILEKMTQGSSKENKKRKLNGNLNTNQSLVLLSIQCMCNLLLSLSHFNYRNNLVNVLVPWMNDDSLDGQFALVSLDFFLLQTSLLDLQNKLKISQLCCDTFSKLFKQDKVGEVSLEATKMISKYVKSQSYRVKPCVLKVFLLLRINDLDVLSLRENKEKENKTEKMKGKNKRDKLMKAKMSKKERKRQKEMKVLEKELQVTQAVEGQEKRAKLQTEMLKLVFATYFRILKNRAKSSLLSPVLEGLAKHAHLINVDFFSDLMTALQGLINKEELSITDKLNCALTAFKILSGQGEALNIDPRGFYCTLYTALLQLDAGMNDDEVLTALKCLDVMIKKRTKQVPIQRVSSFAKRLSTVSLHLMPNSSLALLAFIRIFFQLHPRCQNLLDSETMGTGVFRPEVDDPELCNTDSTTSWELSYLTSRHYHPTVRTLAGHVVQGSSSKGVGSNLTRMQPEEFFKSFDSSEMKLNPEISNVIPNKHQSKKTKIIWNGDNWRDSCIESVVANSIDFTAQNQQVEFKLPSFADW